ncbi:Rrf2 family transcriptional regulator [candidate division WOR-3 bacterium]|nr:Rrf2 family transcriptional regulator [candidate division WOR-3 bacterium]
MKLLTKNTDYAVRALLELSKTEDYVSAKTVSKNQKIPYQYLRKILQTLAKNGWAEAKEGIHGGFKLKAEPSQIRISKLINIFQGDIELSDCLFRKKICFNRKHCALRKELKKIEKLVVAEFERLTLADLVYKSKEAEI